MALKMNLISNQENIIFIGFFGTKKIDKLYHNILTMAIVKNVLIYPAIQELKRSHSF